MEIFKSKFVNGLQNGNNEYDYSKFSDECFMVVVGFMQFLNIHNNTI